MNEVKEEREITKNKKKTNAMNACDSYATSVTPTDDRLSYKDTENNALVDDVNG